MSEVDRIIYDMPFEPLCGWGWLRQHEHDLDNWHLTIMLVRPGSKQTIVIKDKRIEKEVVKMLRGK